LKNIIINVITNKPIVEELFGSVAIVK